MPNLCCNKIGPKGFRSPWWAEKRRDWGHRPFQVLRPLLSKIFLKRMILIREKRNWSSARSFRPWRHTQSRNQRYITWQDSSSERSLMPLIEIPFQERRGRPGLQAMLRSIGDVNFAFKDWAEKKHYLKMVTYLKSRFLRIRGSHRDIRPWESRPGCFINGGAKEVMITHASEWLFMMAKKSIEPHLTRKTFQVEQEGGYVLGSYMSRRLHHELKNP